MLRELMLRTGNQVAKRNPDLFIDGKLSRPSGALNEILDKHGWTLERLRDTDRTLLLAACVNAHKGRTTRERLARFEATLRGSKVDRAMDRYRQLVRSLPDLRAAVLEGLNRQDVTSFEEQRNRSAKKLDLVPSAVLLDPSAVGLNKDDSRRVVKAIDAIAGPELKDLIFRRRGMTVARRRQIIRQLASRIIAAVEGSHQWSRHINRFRSTIKGLIRLRRRTEGRHRIPWEVSVQTGEDSSSRTYIMERFRTPGNPFLLVLTNVGMFGVDLHSYCWDVVHYTPDWTPHAAEQKTGRIDRPRDRAGVARLDIGSRSRLHHIRVHHLIWPFTYDERILSRLNLRAQLAERLLGSKHQAALERSGPVNLDQISRRFRPLDLTPRRTELK
jgi:hypothetical protein